MSQNVFIVEFIVKTFGSAGSLLGTATGDLIIRHNYFRNVLKGIYIYRKNSPSTGNTIGRIIAIQNQIELLNWSSACGIQIDAVADNTSNLGHTTVSIRGNRIRPLDGGLGTGGMRDIRAASVANLGIDNNWVDTPLADEAVQHGSATNAQSFNNRSIAGDLPLVTILTGTAPYKHQGELTIDAELLYAEL